MKTRGPLTGRNLRLDDVVGRGMRGCMDTDDDGVKMDRGGFNRDGECVVMLEYRERS